MCPLPSFVCLVNPISTRGADYGHNITMFSPRFSDLLTVLHTIDHAYQILGPSSGCSIHQYCNFPSLYFFLYSQIQQIFFVILDLIRKSKLCPCHKVLPKNLANFRCFNLDCCWLLSLKLKPFEFLSASNHTMERRKDLFIKNLLS